MKTLSSRKHRRCVGMSTSIFAVLVLWTLDLAAHAQVIRPLAADYVTVFESPDPARVFAYSPGIVRLESGRLVATLDLGGPAAEGGFKFVSN